MKFLSDKALERLRDGADTPDLAARATASGRVARGRHGSGIRRGGRELQRRVALKVLDVRDRTATLQTG